MNEETFNRIAELREQAQQVADEHEPVIDRERTEAKPAERFRRLAQFVIDHDEIPISQETGGKEFSVRAVLPTGTAIILKARTANLEPPSADDIYEITAEWTPFRSQSPLHKDSVGIIDDDHPYDYELARLARVEESFAEARPHI